jgi:lipoprotein-releasing system permease protein
MRLLFAIAIKHILARKRQSLVSLSGIIIGVAFFLAISSLMQGSQRDFIARLVDKYPHITIYDEYRIPKTQPVETVYQGSLVDIRNVKPQTDTRGIRGHRQIIDGLLKMPNLRASAVQTGQAILSFAGREANLELNGITPHDMRNITSIEEDIIQGSIDDLIANRNGIIVGHELLRKHSLSLGDNVTLSSSIGHVWTFKIVGVFRTGNVSQDETKAYADIKRVQALTDRLDRVNLIIIKIDNPEAANEIATIIERRFNYKTVSWQEANEGLINTLTIRNIIMYSVVSAVLVVAAFGIYNIISTVVIEKHRDIAILKSMGFTRNDIMYIFVIQGFILGIAGICAGIPLGCLIMLGLEQLTFRPPGVDPLNIPMDWSLMQFIIAATFALSASILAAWLPAKKAVGILPVDILRGGQ